VDFEFNAEAPSSQLGLFLPPLSYGGRER